MKMSDEHFKALKSRIHAYLDKPDCIKFAQYESMSFSSTRFQWDVYHNAQVRNYVSLNEYTDAHIHTAIKAAIRSHRHPGE